MHLWRCSAMILIGVWGVAGCGPNDKTGVKTAATKDQPSKEQIENAKPATPPRILSETHLAAGRMLEQQGDNKGAIGQYEKAIAADPRQAAAYNLLGMLYQKIGRAPDAEVIYRRGIQIAPEWAVLRNNLGYCYLTQERFADAEREFREALSTASDFKRARMNLAITLARTGREKESLQEFGVVVSADAAYYNLAMIRAGQRDYRGAESALLEALAINTDCPAAKAQLQKVRVLARGGGGKIPDTKTQADKGQVLAGGTEEKDNAQTGN